MRIVISKGEHLLRLLDGEGELMRASVALGRNPLGAKEREGDLRTPEGIYQICLAKEKSKFGLSLGLNYPNADDARRGYEAGRIDLQTMHAITEAIAQGRRPPWGSPLGGEVYIHEGDVQSDWTAGCIALQPADMALLYGYRYQIEDVEINP